MRRPPDRKLAMLLAAATLVALAGVVVSRTVTGAGAAPEQLLAKTLGRS